ncbi:hypothetical protein UlMin_008282 [Ulmus minor]
MEKISVQSPITPISFAEIFLPFLVMINWFLFLRDLYSALSYALQQLFLHFPFIMGRFEEAERNIDERPSSNKMELLKERITVSETKIGEIEEEKLCIGEIRGVMDKVHNGLVGEDWKSSDMSELFEEEVSLEEVKEAFELFDENKDGFIDALEVKKVLFALGFMEASEAECKKMIGAFDKDGNGKIDFNEFVKLMEVSFS